MKKQSIHDFSYEDKQAALNEANDIMNPKEKLNEIEGYINDCLGRNIAPILRKSELEFLLTLARQSSEVSK